VGLEKHTVRRTPASKKKKLSRKEKGGTKRESKNSQRDAEKRGPEWGKELPRAKLVGKTKGMGPVLFHYLFGGNASTRELPKNGKKKKRVQPCKATRLIRKGRGKENVLHWGTGGD